MGAFYGALFLCGGNYLVELRGGFAGWNWGVLKWGEFLITNEDAAVRCGFSGVLSGDGAPCGMSTVTLGHIEMAYTLQAIIAKEGIMRVDHVDAVRVVRLNGGVEMIPLGEEARKRLRIDFLPLTDEGAAILPDKLSILCRELSRSGLLAYVEAEFLGGTGTQAYAMFENGHASEAPSFGEDVINRALRKLGVVASAKRDEFDYAGLGKHRDTEDWLE